MRIFYVEDLGHKYIVSEEKIDEFLSNLNLSSYERNLPKIKEINITDDWTEV